MKILVCSKNNKFFSILAQRLRAESHEVYLLTGEDELKDRHITNVFQRYDFTYSDENVIKIMSNISVEVVIIAGYMDFELHDESIQKKSIDYITGMSNLVLSAKRAGIKRVIYCSTYKIFEGNDDEFIEKYTKSITYSFDNGALSQVDAFLTSCRDQGVFDVEIVRFPEIYGNYAKDNFYDDFCTSMIMDYLDDKDVKYRQDAKHMVLSVQDAVQVLINVLNTEKKEEIYHIDSEVVTERDVADIVVQLDKNRNSVTEETVVKDYKKPFPLSVYEPDNSKLKFSPRYTIEDIMPELYENFSKERQKTVVEKNRTSLKKVLRTFLETTILFLIVVVLEYAIFTFAENTNIDLYLIFVIIIAVVYGVSYAMFATALSIAGKMFFLVAGIVPTNSNVDYQLFLEVLQLVLCAVIVGLMRDNYKRKNFNLEEINDYNTQQIADITRINESNLYVKNIYEKRIASYNNNLGRLYNIISQLSFLDVRKIIFQTAKVVSEFIETDHVAIYVSSKRSSFFRLGAATSDKSRSVGKSLLFEEELYFYNSLANHEVYMNRDFNEEQPTFITAVYGKEDNVEAIIMIWAMGLEQINLYQSSLISILSRLVEKTMNSALQYEDLYFESSYIDGTRIMTIEAFKEKLAVLDEGSEMGLVSYTVLKTDVPKDINIKDIFPQVEKLVRDTDYIGSDMVDIYVILSNSDESDAHFVLNRFIKNELPTRIITKNDVMTEGEGLESFQAAQLPEEVVDLASFGIAQKVATDNAVEEKEQETKAEKEVVKEEKSEAFDDIEEIADLEEVEEDIDMMSSLDEFGNVEEIADLEDIPGVESDFADETLQEIQDESELSFEDEENLKEIEKLNSSVQEEMEPLVTEEQYAHFEELEALTDIETISDEQWFDDMESIEAQPVVEDVEEVESIQADDLKDDIVEIDGILDIDEVVEKEMLSYLELETEPTEIENIEQLTDIEEVAMLEELADIEEVVELEELADIEEVVELETLADIEEVAELEELAELEEVV